MSSLEEILMPLFKRVSDAIYPYDAYSEMYGEYFQAKEDEDEALRRFNAGEIELEEFTTAKKRTTEASGIITESYIFLGHTDIGLQAIIYGRHYEIYFEKGNARRKIVLTITDEETGEKTLSYIYPYEILSIDHILFPFIRLHERPSNPKDSKYKQLAYQRADDMAVRLHFIMSGDIYEITERVLFKGAGTQICIDYIISSKENLDKS